MNTDHRPLGVFRISEEKKTALPEEGPSRVHFFSMSKLNAQYDIPKAIERVVGKHNYVLGDEVRCFEQEFARFCGVNFAIGVANGTDALELALRALGVGPKQKVVTVANAGFYASAAILAIGATPVYVDISPSQRNMCIDALEKLLRSEDCACIVVTHLFGYLADIEDAVRLADLYGIPVLEDCAQAHGAQRGPRVAGSFGKAAAFSFYPTKNLGAIGDGGAVVTSDPEIADRVRSLRQYGWQKKYDVRLSGGKNSRLDEIQAAILRDKLPLLHKTNRHRVAIACQYNQAFEGLPIQCPQLVERANVCHLYVVETPKRDELQEYMRLHGVQTLVHYPIADNEQYVMKPMNDKLLPRTKNSLSLVLSLPCYPGMQQKDILRTISVIQKFFQGLSKC